MGVQPPNSVSADASFRTLVHGVVERVDTRGLGVHVVTPPKWQTFVDQLILQEYVASTSNGSAVVVGPPATVLAHASAHEQPFGFVMPVAKICRWWQRSKPWRNPATLGLWEMGWSPISIDRILVAGDDATYEFVIGIARRTPKVSEAAS